MNNLYFVRGFRQENPAEIERLNLMYYHPAVAKAKGYHTRGFGLRKNESLLEKYEPMNDSRLMKRRQESVSFAVADRRDLLVGWVWFYHDLRHPLPKRVQKRLGVQSNSLIYQISYEKMLSEGWPKKLLERVRYTPIPELHKPRKGVIVTGLKLAIERLKRRYMRRYSRTRPIVLYAFVLPDNIPSKKVLIENGFVNEARLYKYDRILHELWVRIV